MTLENGWSVMAPGSSFDGDDAMCVEDATFYVSSGSVCGGLGVSGTGVTISTTRESEYSPGTATFEAGLKVYGGDATREQTTKGSGLVVYINRGKFVPGTGYTIIETCGVAKDDGVALQVIQGKAIVKGGEFDGIFYNVKGDIEVHSCVV